MKRECASGLKGKPWGREGGGVQGHVVAIVFGMNVKCEREGDGVGFMGLQNEIVAGHFRIAGERRIGFVCREGIGEVAGHCERGFVLPPHAPFTEEYLWREGAIQLHRCGRLLVEERLKLPLRRGHGRGDCKIAQGDVLVLQGEGGASFK